MGRRHQHEEHANHEAWAIPYGDLVTLLLAFFVVMYAMSSVNEGKYRILSDSLVAAFRGSPRTLQPIQVGEKSVGSGADINMTIVQQAMLDGQPRSMLEPSPLQVSDVVSQGARHASESQYEAEHTSAAMMELESVAAEVEQAMSELIRDQMIVVRRHGVWVEVEIRTDILFPSGVAKLSAEAQNILKQLAQTLKPFPNAIRVEGHTDNLPIKSAAFTSNWELSAARAASVVHLFTDSGLDPHRLAIVGLGEYRPAYPNDTEQNRNLNRRVLLVILSGNGNPEGDYAGDRGQPESEPVPQPQPQVPQPAVTTAQAAAPAPAITAAPIPPVSGGR
ncbi:flagellar motor protein MotD [Peristeroidobacter agariperforans]|uniref:flagellar motor protein MotD n=1 Tax=Peristeroidobacter agariperforans TaxID=268404 RepID=UPI00101DE5EF|nr:flagellar motor protein MotD [Peristeroidobacter agariperforans]